MAQIRRSVIPRQLMYAAAVLGLLILTPARAQAACGYPDHPCQSNCLSLICWCQPLQSWGAYCLECGPQPPGWPDNARYGDAYIWTGNDACEEQIVCDYVIAMYCWWEA
jgi:hypothetical protein